MGFEVYFCNICHFSRQGYKETTKRTTRDWFHCFRGKLIMRCLVTMLGQRRAQSSKYKWRYLWRKIVLQDMMIFWLIFGTFLYV